MDDDQCSLVTRAEREKEVIRKRDGEKRHRIISNSYSYAGAAPRRNGRGQFVKRNQP